MRLPLLASVVLCFTVSLLAADTGRYILVVSDDTRDLFEMPSRSNENAGVSTTGWSPTPHDPRPQPRSPLYAEARWSESGPVTGFVAIGGEGEQPRLGTFSLVPGARVRIEGNGKMGVPPLWIRMINEPRDCGWSAADVKTTPSLLVQAVDRSEAACYATVQNLSSKKIVGVSVWEVGDKRVPIVVAKRIEPSATLRIPMPKENPGIRAVAFEDGTYEGDPVAAKRIVEKATRAR